MGQLRASLARFAVAVRAPSSGVLTDGAGRPPLTALRALICELELGGLQTLWHLVDHIVWTVPRQPR